MGIFDKLKGAASTHQDQVSQGLDKVGDAVDQKTGGQHSEHIDQGVEMAKGHLGVESADPQPAAGEGRRRADRAEGRAETGAEGRRRADRG